MERPENKRGVPSVFTCVDGTEVKTKEEMNRQIQYLSEKYHAKIRLLETPLMPVSYHELRASLQSGDSVSEYMPAAVCSYIKQHQLYR